MNERKIYLDIPGGRNSFHSAILTTFSFDFYHFENQVLRALKSKWISSVNVLVDQKMLDTSLGVSSFNVKAISKSYAVSGVYSKGAFHPKMNLFIGENKLLLLFGSGNITVGGHGKNHEIFTGFFADKDNQIQLPLIIETCNYLLDISKDLDEYSRKRISEILFSDKSLYKISNQVKHQFQRVNDDFEVCLLYNDEQSIFNQLISKIDAKTITNITIISPYYDDDGITLIDLSANFPNAEMEVFLQKKFGLHPHKILEDTKIKFYEWDETVRGQKKLTGNSNFFRKLHSKIYILRNNDTQFCLLGSANATRYGLGNLTSFPINHEFGVLYKSNTYDFLEELQISGSKIPVSRSEMIQASALPGDNNPGKKVFVADLKEAEIRDNKLKVSFKLKDLKKDCSITLYNHRGDICTAFPITEPTKEVFEYKMEKEVLEHNPFFCTINTTNEEIVSHKVTIKFINSLNNTNPSSTNRSISQIFYSSADGSFNDFEIIELLNNNYEVAAQKKKNATTSKKVENEEKRDDDLHGITYEEAIELSKNSEAYKKAINLGAVSRILDILNNIFDEQSEKNTDENFDEEEQADAETGRERKSDVTNNNEDIKSISQSKRILCRINKMFDNYIKSVRLIQKKSIYEIGKVDLDNMLLLSYLANRVCFFTDYTLHKDINPTEWHKELNATFKTKMLDALAEFSKVCIRFGFNNFQNEEDKELYQEQHALKNRTLNHIIYNLSIIEKNNIELVIDDIIFLAGLNILKRFGNLPFNFSEVEKPFRGYPINKTQIIRLKEELILKLSGENPEFIYHNTLGVCKHLCFESNQAKIKSVYGIYTLPKKTLIQVKFE